MHNHQSCCPHWELQALSLRGRTQQKPILAVSSWFASPCHGCGKGQRCSGYYRANLIERSCYKNHTCPAAAAFPLKKRAQAKAEAEAEAEAGIHYNQYTAWLMILAICRGNAGAVLRTGEGSAALAEGLGGPHLLCHVVLRRSASQGPTLQRTMT